MNASELYQMGQLPQAIDAQTAAVKADPANPDKRVFLFELLAFAGDLDRARKQVDAIQYGDPALDTAVLSYRKLLDAEEQRRRVFRDGLQPKFFSPPSDHIVLRLEAITCLREQRPANALELLTKAEEARPPVKGQLNSKPFTLLRDCDDLFGSVVEVMAHGVYYWLPLEQVVNLTLPAPQFPRDLLWMPARLELPDATGDVFLPAMYPNSHEHADNQVKLGRMTDWTSAPNSPVLGAGLRLYLVDDDAIKGRDWRQLEVNA
jgi:type VI secretion system protein ImpE